MPTEPMLTPAVMVRTRTTVIPARTSRNLRLSFWAPVGVAGGRAGAGGAVGADTRSGLATPDSVGIG